MALQSERLVQESYWKEHCTELTIEAMMLDSQASEIDSKERPEVFSIIPPLQGKIVMELGCGIGRFTSMLADKADQVIAVDFIPNTLSKNREINAGRTNVQFICSDVTSSKLFVGLESLDLVFSNWLLMYLADSEVVDLALRVLKSLKPGGSFFFRESCFHQSGDFKRRSNPTHYRHPSFYNNVFQTLNYVDDDNVNWNFELSTFKCLDSYVQTKHTQNQIVWLWKKCKVEKSEEETQCQKFLDNGQYQMNSILRYERVFGAGYVSTGGEETTSYLTSRLNLKEGEKVLDIGCGIGGGDFFISNKYDVHVTAIDLSVNMISIALERSIGTKSMVEFEVADCMKKKYSEASFDVVYSRDTLLHIHDKPSLFRNVYRWLKKGGRLMITDYCCGDSPHSSEFDAYVKQRNYDLRTVKEYQKMLEAAGFEPVVAEDKTEEFVLILNKELNRLVKEKDAFVQDFSLEDYEYLVKGWRSKLQFCAKGDQKWGFFIAYKS